MYGGNLINHRMFNGSGVGSDKQFFQPTEYTELTVDDLHFTGQVHTKFSSLFYSEISSSWSPYLRFDNRKLDNRLTRDIRAEKTWKKILLAVVRK